MDKSRMCQMLLFFKYPESARVGIMSEKAFYDDLGYLVQNGYLEGNITMNKKMTEQYLKFVLTEDGEAYLDKECKM
ncbi:hypothetical protein [Mammaliicoccus sciuri]|uniref:hypothetical protein n=1 Tax=Mammaliicoccus sciuri TaxID=1296 RepID=UPI002DBC880D|nr:hypothetical protein [Mammaliicoccus sciuri]MEB5758293.1 hypothetical protein [Mammaliicoccus sciuri]